MENKPITPFLKYVSCLFVILAVWSAIINAIALISLIALPGLTDLIAEAGEAAVEVTPLTYISIAICLVCAIINIVLGTMAFKHKNLTMAYKIAGFTMIANAVFTATDLSAPADYVNLVVGLIVPALFLVAVYKQNKLDNEEK